MKRLKFTSLIIAAVSSTMFLGACKKDDKPSKTKAQLLAQGTWKFDKAGIDADKNGTIDQDSPPDACSADNFFTFSSDGTGVMDEGATKCDGADPQTVPFTWVLKNNDTVINAGDLSDNTDATILALDDNQLVVYDDIDFGGVSMRVISAFKH